MTAEVNWRPTQTIRVNARYTQLTLDRRRDGTNLSTSRIPRLKLEYQISRSVFVRFVGQYGSAQVDALRYPPTDDPILLRDDATGTYVVSARRTTNELGTDWLFSYRPNSGTVVYLGYGSTLTESHAFAFRELRRVGDGFFFKLSYLFRR